MSTIEGLPTCTAHCALDVWAGWLPEAGVLHVMPNVAALVLAGGLGTTTVAVPDCAPPVENPRPVLVPEGQEYAMVSDMPASATCGLQEICAVVGPPPVPEPEEHCQLLTQAPVYSGFQVPAAHPLGSGCAGAAGHAPPCAGAGVHAVPEQPY